MITNPDYAFPLAIPGGYFNGRLIPPFTIYLTDYHIHFMRYLYYICIMGATGPYPIDMDLNEIQTALDECRKTNCEKCQGKISKILIAEAPPPNPLNYFYNPNSPWTALGGPGAGGAAYTRAIKTALFPGIAFATKIDFLIACARKGFLLLDLFPYAIPYTNRGGARYYAACLSAWGFGLTPFPFNVLNTLNNLKCCIDKSIAFGFALTSFGRNILVTPGAVMAFDTWCVTNGIVLNPPLNLDQLRVITPPGASNYLRLCHRRGLFGPCPNLLNLAGF
ncbi:MAG: hypothetical protein ACKO55_11770 [Bacteroidota bacterium]